MKLELTDADPQQQVSGRGQGPTRAPQARAPKSRELSASRVGPPSCSPRPSEPSRCSPRAYSWQSKAAIVASTLLPPIEVLLIGTRLAP